MAPKGYVEIEATVLAETDMAVYADCGLDNSVWLPKSQLEDWPDVNDTGEILMPEWLAIEKDLI